MPSDRTLGTLTVDRLTVQVRILDAKSSYGQIRLLVEPVSGAGQTWVAAERVS